MNRIWKFLFFFTWLVIIGVIILLALTLASRGDVNQQQVVNQYVSKGNGLSAYEVALKNGFKGTESEWVLSLQGKNGNNSISTNTVVEKQVETQTKVIEQVPVTGKSSYDIWLDNGNIGTQADYLASLKGKDGASTTTQLRYNEDIGKFQIKLSTDNFWKVVSTCGGLTGKVCN